MFTAIGKIYSQRGGIRGFYQGLIPWAWIEASTKGAVLLFTASAVDSVCKQQLGMSAGQAGVVSGMLGGVVQAYTTMGFCTFMKTVEVTRHKAIHTTLSTSRSSKNDGGIGPSTLTSASAPLQQQQPSTVQLAMQILRKEGIRGINKGVSAVALRQMTNWGSRFGISRITEDLLLLRRQAKESTEKDKMTDVSTNGSKGKLSRPERLVAAVIGGALGCWNQPIEVVRVEMQSQKVDPGRPAKPNVWNIARYIYKQHGLRGLYRGVLPRIGLSVYLTVCMVFGGDELKAKFK